MDRPFRLATPPPLASELRPQRRGRPRRTGGWRQDGPACSLSSAEQMGVTVAVGGARTRWRFAADDLVERRLNPRMLEPETARERPGRQHLLSAEQQLIGEIPKQLAERPRGNPEEDRPPQCPAKRPAESAVIDRLRSGRIDRTFHAG